MPSTEKRIRFNILDIIIIIVSVALITGIFFRNNIVEMLSEDTSGNITYTFVIKELDGALLPGVKPNTLLSDPESGGEMGRILSVSFEKSIVNETAADGSIMSLEKSGFYDVTVRVAGNGFSSDTGVFLDGVVLIAPGMNKQIITEIAVYEGFILSID